MKPICRSKPIDLKVYSAFCVRVEFAVLRDRQVAVRYFSAELNIFGSSNSNYYDYKRYRLFVKALNLTKYTRNLKSKSYKSTTISMLPTVSLTVSNLILFYVINWIQNLLFRCKRSYLTEIAKNTSHAK